MLCKKRTTTPPPLFSLSMETVVNNEDPLTEILVLLPIKSLVKFKCVSKHWLALITSHAFSARRRSYLNSADSLLVHTNHMFFKYSLIKLDSCNHDFVPAHVFENNKPFLKTKIIQSCNGLFLCCDVRSPLRRLRFYYRNYNHTHSSTFCVWNPTSKKYTLLPPLLSLPCSLKGISLAFDPSKSLQYKVVAVCQYILAENCYHIQVYSSKAGTWRVSVRFFNPPPVDFLRGVFCDGAIHWNSTVRFDCDVIHKVLSSARPVSNLYLDIDEEQVKTLKTPGVRWCGCKSSLVNCFQVSVGSRLYLLRRSSSCKKLEVYQLRKDCSEWFVEYCVDLPDSLIFVDENSKIVRLKKEDKSFIASYVCGYDDAYHYIGSLACV